MQRSTVYRRAVPIILANASVPLLGLVDTAVLGFHAGKSDLAALAIGTTLFNLLFWNFGFLRMSTTGFIAQAADQPQKQTLILLRALSLATLLGVILILLHYPIGGIAFLLFQAPAEIESIAADYFAIRVFAAPATLTLYCVTGTLIGLGHSKSLLALQLTLNTLNALLNCAFVIALSYGMNGLAWGTVISEYIIAIGSLFLIHRYLFALKLPATAAALYEFLSAAAFRRLFAVNRDIFIRTLFLLLSFFWFTNQSAQQGDTVLAANQVLLALISFSAFFLDGFAFVAEAEVGRHYSQGSIAQFRRAVRLTTEAAAIIAAALAGILWLGGDMIVGALTNLSDVQQQALAYIPYAAIYILCSFAAFQLDGIFIGTIRAKAMRNASVLSFFGFIVAYYLLTYIYPADGLWLSFVFYVVLRAVSLGWYYPGLLRVHSGPMTGSRPRD